MKKRIVIGSLLVIIVLISVMVVTLGKSDLGTVCSQSFSMEVAVTDYVADPDTFETEIVIEKEGDYVFRAEWAPSEEGLTTGCMITGENGEIYFASTAEACNLSSKSIELKEGKYTLTLAFIASKERMEAFLESADYSEDTWDVPYTGEHEYAKEGNFSIDYKLWFEKEDTALVVGLIVGVLVGLAIVAIILTLTKKGKEVKCKFDERQELVRGRGFKYAFFTILIGNAVVFLLETAQISLYMSAGIAAMIIALLGICVYANYCIWNDGYFALNERVGSLIVIFIVMGLFNLGLGILAFVDGRAVQNGELTFQSMNLFCGIMALEICGVLFLKKIKDREGE
ncbi:MAG: hypothetical protein IJX86_06010 [Lachnospiraceae bacterium]|nr:hypothetical protein [Lachnospiraceae bacterium]